MKLILNIPDTIYHLLLKDAQKAQKKVDEFIVVASLHGSKKAIEAITTLNACLAKAVENGQLPPEVLK